MTSRASRPLPTVLRARDLFAAARLDVRLPTDGDVVTARPDGDDVAVRHPMQGVWYRLALDDLVRVPAGQPCALIPAINLVGRPFLWPVPADEPGDEGRLRAVACRRWVMVDRFPGGVRGREVIDGIPLPDWSGVDADALGCRAFGDQVIHSPSHPLVGFLQRLHPEPPAAPDSAG